MSDLIALGDMGISIPTDEAIKALNNETLKGIDLLYLNLRTLARNTVNCTNNPEQNTSAMVKQLITDIDTIRQFVEGDHRVRVVVYLTDIEEGLTKKEGFTNPDKIKRLTTERQIALADSQKELVHRVAALGVIDLLTTTPIKPDKELNGSVLILTHEIVDLVDYYHFNEIKLLESHTGAIKGISEFNTKLNLDKLKRGYVPFNSITLQVFGDGTTILGEKKSIKDAFLSLCEKRHLNPASTVDRLVFSIRDEKNPDLMPLLEYKR